MKNPTNYNCPYQQGHRGDPNNSNYVCYNLQVMSIAWHPVHESLFVSGGGEGSVLFWMVG